MVSTRKNKKGLTPIIATILLLMMAVSAAAGMFYWLSRVQGQQQGSIESVQTKMFSDLTSSVDVVDADYNDTTQVLDLYLQNSGNSKILLDNSTATPTTQWILFDAAQRAICATDWHGGSGAPACMLNCAENSTIAVGQIRQVRLNLTLGGCSVRSQANGTVLAFQIDFSGKTKTAGSFIK